MMVDSSSLLQRLQELQQLIADAIRCGELLNDALKRRDYETFFCMSLDAERHVEAMAVITGDIRGQVVPADGLGDALDSLSELVLRAVWIVVLTELSALRDAVSEPSARERAHALFQGPFRSVDDLTASVDAELSQITDGWSACRRLRHVDRASYRAGLRVAHASTRELGCASGAARCLREGFSRMDWPAVQEPPARIVAALAIRIDVDPDLPLIACSRPRPGVAMERFS